MSKNINETFKRDVFDPEIDYELEEASGEVDGKAIIGRVRGSFFVPDGKSRNNRFYSKALWEKVLNDSEIQEKLKTRRMLGSVGHDQAIDDKAVREGALSHIVSKLEINESTGKLRGIGEALILDTPAGKNLNTYLRAGVKLFTSSRALGKFQGNENGVPKVDENSYKFDTFDFVLDPGFLEANPKLVEELTKNQTDNKGENKMDNELLEKLARQNAELQANFKKLMEEKEEMASDAEDMEKENAELKQKIADAQAALADQEKEDAEQEEKLSAYAKLGTAEDLANVLASNKEIIAKFEAIGTPEKITEALSDAKSMLDQYKVFGTPKQIDKAINGAIKSLKEYKEIGSVEEINKSLDASIEQLKKYNEFGTIEELNKTFEKMNKMASTLKAESVDKKVKDLASELRVTEDAIRKLHDKGLKDDEIREVLKKVSESVSLNNKYRKTDTTQTKINENKTVENKIDEDKSKSPLFQPRINRVMGSFNKK